MRYLGLITTLFIFFAGCNSGTGVNDSFATSSSLSTSSDSSSATAQSSSFKTSQSSSLFHMSSASSLSISSTTSTLMSSSSSSVSSSSQSQSSSSPISQSSSSSMQSSSLSSAANSDTSTPKVSAFIHPGVLNSEEDFLFVRAKVDQAQEPWKTGWNALVNNSRSALGKTPAPLETLIRGGDGQNFSRVIQELQFAYALALRWKISGDREYGDLAIAYLNAWSSTLQEVTGNSDRFLAAGLYGYQFAAIGEIMRTYDGWAETDQKRLADMLLNFFYPLTHTFLTTHNGSCTSHYWANWDLANVAGMMAIGIFADREDIYAEALDYMYHGKGNGSLDNLMYYRHAGNMGQSQESGRDQGHTTLNVSLYGVIAKMAWNQGDDLFAYNNYELLAVSEYVARYNLNEEVPYIFYGPNCASARDGIAEISSGGRGIIRSSWALIYNHYQNRLGIAAPWSEKATQKAQPEYPGNGDEPGWGTLTESRDPYTAIGVPKGVSALLNNGIIELSWWGVTGAEQYRLKRSLSQTGLYHTIAELNASELLTYNDTNVTQGERYYYQVNAVTSGVEGSPSITRSIQAGDQLILHLSFDDSTTPGILGNALAFNGTDYYQSLNKGVVANLADFTVAAWIYQDEQRSWARLFDFGSSDHRYLTLVPYTAQSQSCFMITKVSSNGEQKVCTDPIPSGEWVHVAFTLSGHTGTLYINGKEAANNNNFIMSPHQLGVTTNNWLGRSQYSADPLFKGKLDDFRIYSGALSASKIADLASN